MKFLIDLDLLLNDTRLDILKTTSNQNVLNQYSTSGNSHERMAVAENPKTNSNILDVLSSDLDKRVKNRVIRNHNTSRKTLKKLILNPYLGMDSVSLLAHPNITRALKDLYIHTPVKVDTK